MWFVLINGGVSLVNLSPYKLGKGQALNVSLHLCDRIKFNLTGWDKVSPSNINPHLN